MTLQEAIKKAEAAEAEVKMLRGLLWYGWNEMNSIRAMSGVPLDIYVPHNLLYIDGCMHVSFIIDGRNLIILKFCLINRIYAPFVYRLGFQIFTLARGVRFSYGVPKFFV